MKAAAQFDPDNRIPSLFLGHRRLGYNINKIKRAHARCTGQQPRPDLQAGDRQEVRRLRHRHAGFARRHPRDHAALSRQEPLQRQEGGLRRRRGDPAGDPPLHQILPLLALYRRHGQWRDLPGARLERRFPAAGDAPTRPRTASTSSITSRRKAPSSASTRWPSRPTRPIPTTPCCSSIS